VKTGIIQDDDLSRRQFLDQTVLNPSFNERRVAIALKGEGSEDSAVAPPGDHADSLGAMPPLQVIEALGTVTPSIGIGFGVIHARFIDIHDVCGGIGLKGF
jgi:hypothetical protein